MGLARAPPRLVTGNHPLYAELEKRLARLKGTQALAYSDRAILPISEIIPALVGPGDLVLIDELAHACLWGGSRLSRSTVIAFRHSDLGHVEGLLTELRRRYDHVLIATDGVFSMDGDIAPLHGLTVVAQQHDAWLLVDDAHGLGVVGGGRGSTFVGGENPKYPCKWARFQKQSARMAVISAPRCRGRSYAQSRTHA